MMIHRLHDSGGNLIQMVPPALLGGVDLPDPQPALVPADPVLDREVRALHQLARRGDIPADVADRQINAYLLAAQEGLLPVKKARWLVLPPADAPHHTLLPDLGNVIHALLARAPVPGALSYVLEQCLPGVRCSLKASPFLDFQGVLLNVVLALLLGLYPGSSVKRPEFCVRSRAYARVHALLTAPGPAQARFCRDHEPVLVVACMEYVARVLPACMPAQAAFLSGRDPVSPLFFRRVPQLCDELRQGLDGGLEWPALRASCEAVLDKVARLRKAGSVVGPAREPTLQLPPPDAPHSFLAHWDAPALLGSRHPGEFRLLAEALGLNESLLRLVQRTLQVFPLPANLRQIQVEALARSGMCRRAAHLRTRLTVCAHCVLACRSVDQTRLRLNTLTQQLLCSQCGRDELLHIDMLGRVLRHRQTYHVLCPSCVSVRPYSGDGPLWQPLTTPCQHRPPPRRPPKTLVRSRQPCSFCGEPTPSPPAERVDHLTGEMRAFHFCLKHAPRAEALRQCVNARQLETQFGA